MKPKKEFVEIKDFAEYIIYFFNSKGSLITNKKLQKLLYYTQAWHLVYFEGDKLFNEEPEAWVHGAVYPSVYRKFKNFGSKPIVLNQTKNRKEIKDWLTFFKLSEEQKNFVSSVLIAYGKKDSIELELLNHREKPWLEARGDLEDYDLSSNKISLDTMEDYYYQLSQKSKNEL